MNTFKINEKLYKLYRYSLRLFNNNDVLSRILIEMGLSYAIKNELLLNRIIHDNKRKASNIIYDIGCNEGIYAFSLAKLSNTKVYAFEPNPEAYKEIVKRTKILKYTGTVLPFNFALSDSNYDSPFYISSARGRSSLYEYDAQINNNTIVNKILVKCYSIDSLIDQNICLPPSIMKIDVEGHEFEVLVGAKATIEKFRPVIYFEPHKKTDNEMDSEIMNRIADLLKPHHYEFVSLGYPICCYPK